MLKVLKIRGVRLCIVGGMGGTVAGSVCGDELAAVLVRLGEMRQQWEQQSIPLRRSKEEDS